VAKIKKLMGASGLINWKDLSVSKKLYCVVGIMATLIATELFTLLFAMNTLSSVRSFVGAEGLWSKAQKTAVRNLQSYALTRDPLYWDKYLDSLKVPLGDHDARIELEKENFDSEIVRNGFLKGRIHPDDIQGLIKIIRRFHNIPQLHKALVVWVEGDQLIDKFQASAETLKKNILANANQKTIEENLSQIYEVDTSLTELEDRFSYILGEGSRWLEHLLMFMLICTITIVEGSGLFLTFKFSQNLNRSLNELNHAAREVGKRNFKIKAPVRSKDELGQLASSINKMVDDLSSSLGQKEKAVSDSQLKTIFLANMSHEIRTPVGIILGYTDLLKDPHITNAERDHHLSTIDRTGQNLLRIINDVLDVSRVESGYIEIAVTKFKLKSFIQNLSAQLEVKALENQNSLVFKATGFVPEYISTDETRLHQILLNLINNALKFTERGTVEIRYWTQGSNLNFDVADTGPGIDDTGKEKLFQLFSQVDSASTRKHGGSGLGLVLSKRLATLLGGDVILKHSVVGVGSTFSLSVKLYDESSIVEPMAPPSEADLEAIASKNILVVEDSIDNQLLIKLRLKKANANVYFASNGDEGIKKAIELNPDIVLMDIQMPIKDGYQATMELRKKGYKNPIIALTANAMTEDRNRCIKAGCNDYLTKPIEVNKLYSVISKHLKVTV
jgi:signal transduction histidine kinase/CheY-like chemotaxis protein